MIHSNLKPLYKAVKYALVIATVGMGQIICLTDTQAKTVTTHQYQVTAGSLDDALVQFAAQAGVELSFDPIELKGLKTQGLKGSYNVQQGFTTLLAPHRLQAVPTNNGYKIIKITTQQVQYVGELATIDVKAQSGSANKSVSQLPAITVQAINQDGSAENGYVTKRLKQVGPWGEKSLQDTPYSMSVMSSDLIENAIAGDMDQIIKMNPVVKLSAPNTVYGTPYAVFRGFHTQSGIIDGLRLSSTSTGIAMEELDRVELMNGLTGFMYGTGNVGGTSNYVLKRPTYQRLTNLTLGNYGNQQWFGHIDLGNKIDDDGIFAYRINISHQNGKTGKSDQNVERTLFSGALDWNISDKLLVQFEAAHTEYKLDGIDSRFYAYANSSYGTLNYWISPLKNDRTYTPKWTYLDIDTNRAGINATYKIDDNLTFRSAYMYKQDKSESKGMYPAYFADSGWKSAWNYYSAPSWNIAESFYSFLDGQFNTGSIQHKLTVGLSADYLDTKRYVNNSVPGANSPAYTTADQIADYIETDLTISNLGKKYTSSKASNTNFIIGDDITFNKKWSALLGLNYTTVKAKNLSVAGVASSDYNKSELTPTISLIYKPSEKLTTYATYMEGLEKGTIVTDNTALYKNAGEVLKPYLSKQYEVGAKYAVSDDLFISSSLFRIEKANSYNEVDSDGLTTVKQDGRQTHQGLELTLTGKLTDHFTVMTGGTWMDASVDKATNKAFEGKKPTGVSEILAKIYAEYQIPQIEGLSITGGVYHSGKMYKDSANLQKISGYTIFDIGARYKTVIRTIPTTFNFNISNLTNKDYWATTYSLGIPRTIAFSIKTQF
ncbi:TonB-dependent siderophore receptor [Acinetobacter qingfengensis]|uniref:TonB-dependent siderophore receptor n=1 Tax=Acinetobacter qingfengensis TaxID=1262585 RepID=UPI001487919B|nr:TonB-dependent receptor [Acinetobacter qingfengensis]